MRAGSAVGGGNGGNSTNPPEQYSPIGKKLMEASLSWRIARAALKDCLAPFFVGKLPANILAAVDRN